MSGTNQMVLKLFGVLVFGAILMGAIGCAPEPWVSGYAFYPQPAVVDVRQRTTNANAGQTPLTVLVSVVGVQNADEKAQRPYAVTMRLRFENNGPTSVTFDPRSLELVTGALQPFPPPMVQPPGALALQARQRAEVTANFPLPPGVAPGQMNLNNLRLRWQVRIDNYAVPQTALFQRVPGGEQPAGGQPPPNPDLTY